MSIIKKIVMRAVDVTIIGMLIYGDEQMKTFALWAAGFITVVMIFGIFMKMEVSTARQINGGFFKVSIGLVFNFAYTYALIVSGSPIWAFFYIAAAAIVRLNAAKVCSDVPAA